MDEEADVRESCETKYFALISIAQTKSNSSNKPAATKYSMRATSDNINVKLPTIELPSFDGDLTKWHSFADTFQALIHNNTSLTEVQKLCYLRSSLKSEALNVIQALDTTAINYDIAWNLLKNRFCNNRKIVYSHVNAILNLRSTSNIKSFVNTVEQHMRSLHSLDIPIKEWNALLIPLFLTKLDIKIKHDWESHVNIS